jgi:protein-tyrosine-phosphatase
MPGKRKIVFVCTHNAGKSRIAEAYLKELAGDRFEAVSAGTDPSRLRAERSWRRWRKKGSRSNTVPASP